MAATFSSGHAHSLRIKRVQKVHKYKNPRHQTVSAASTAANSGVPEGRQTVAPGGARNERNRGTVKRDIVRVPEGRSDTQHQKTGGRGASRAGAVEDDRGGSNL